MNSRELKICSTKVGGEVLDLELIGYSASSVCDVLNKTYSNIKYMHVRPIEGTTDRFQVHIETYSEEEQRERPDTRGWSKKFKRRGAYL